jgi:NAD(P)-dependent dehydrogenase (short-subunit alcohol dehydrogenase family)
MDKPFLDKKALIVGGTGGIGRAIAIGLAKAGALITVCGGSSEDRLTAAIDATLMFGAAAEGFLCNADMTDAADKILSHCPAPDILVYAYGPFRRLPLEQMSAEDWESIVASNLTMPGTMVSMTLPAMIKRKWGRILLFGGTNTDAIRGFSTTVAYSAAKTGLGVIAKSAAKTAGRFGVTCNVICPGLTDTEYIDETERSYNREKGGEALTPEEIADTALHILGNSAINGAIVAVDKGITV